MARAWYAYKDYQDAELTNSYLYSNGRVTCRDGRKLCAINALYSGTVHPLTISTNLLYYIATGLVTGNAQPQSPVGSKKYVYFITFYY